MATMLYPTRVMNQSPTYKLQKEVVKRAWCRMSGWWPDCRTHGTFSYLCSRAKKKGRDQVVRNGRDLLNHFGIRC